MGNGGGGTGGTLVVTGIAGDTITATKDGKTYSRTFNSAGKAIFKGLSSGTWTVTMTNGSQTVTRNVTITADYSLTMAYFTATITVTYPANSTCTCSDGTTTLTDTNTGTSKKTVAFTVPNTGNWTVSCTDSTKTASKTVTISTDGQAVNVALAYNLLIVNGTDTSVSGGWSVSGDKSYSATLTAGGLAINGPGGGARGTCYTNAFDAALLANFNTLIMEYTLASLYSGADVNKLIIGTAKNSGERASVLVPASSATKRLSIDISKINAGYPYFSLGQLSGFTITTLTLE